jgi:hypothetical protein
MLLFLLFARQLIPQGILLYVFFFFLVQVVSENNKFCSQQVTAPAAAASSASMAPPPQNLGIVAPVRPPVNFLNLIFQKFTLNFFF